MRDRIKSDDGFTLVELLVTMTMSIFVLGAVLLVAETFTSATEANNRLSDVQDDARISGNSMARDIRIAGAFDRADPIAVAQPGDLVLRRSSPVVTGYTGTSWTRYCLVQSGSGWVLRRVAVDGAVPTGDCPTLTAVAPAGSRYDTPTRSPLTSAAVFSYTCAVMPCASTNLIRTVGISLSIRRRNSSTAYVTTSAVTLRNHSD